MSDQGAYPEGRESNMMTTHKATTASETKAPTHIQLCKKNVATALDFESCIPRIPGSLMHSKMGRPYAVWSHVIILIIPISIITEFPVSFIIIILII